MGPEGPPSNFFMASRPSPVEVKQISGVTVGLYNPDAVPFVEDLIKELSAELKWYPDLITLIRADALLLHPHDTLNEGDMLTVASKRRPKEHYSRKTTGYPDE